MSHDYQSPHQHSQPSRKRSDSRQIHKDWRLWVAVVLMLLAMLMYGLF
jgi:hypothetical protein